MYVSGYCVEVKSDGSSTSEKVSIDDCEINKGTIKDDTVKDDSTVEKLDKTAPTLEVTVVNTTLHDYTITVVTSDKSGIKEIRYYVDDVLVYSGLNLTYSSTLPSNNFKYRIESEDNKGNVAVKSGTFNISTCFVAGTKVLTKNGLKNIEDIKVGEYVYTFDPDKNIKELQPVTDTMISKNNKLYEITLENGEVIKATEKHPFYVLDKGWVRSYDLKVGDELTSPKVGLIKIKTIKIKQYKEAITVYNLGVKDNHNYLVTEYEILVHNATPSKTMEY